MKCWNPRDNRHTDECVGHCAQIFTAPPYFVTQWEGSQKQTASHSTDVLLQKRPPNHWNGDTTVNTLPSLSLPPNAFVRADANGFYKVLHSPVFRPGRIHYSFWVKLHHANKMDFCRLSTTWNMTLRCDVKVNSFNFTFPNYSLVNSYR